MTKRENSALGPAGACEELNEAIREGSLFCLDVVKRLPAAPGGFCATAVVLQRRDHGRGDARVLDPLAVVVDPAADGRRLPAVYC